MTNVCAYSTTVKEDINEMKVRCEMVQTITDLTTTNRDLTRHAHHTYTFQGLACETLRHLATCGSGPLLAHGSYESKLKSVLILPNIYNLFI